MMAYNSQSSRLLRCPVVDRLVVLVHACVSRSFVSVDAVRLKEAPLPGELFGGDLGRSEAPSLAR